MTRKQYKALRDKAYKLATEMERLTIKFGAELPRLEETQEQINRTLDVIDFRGLTLGFLNNENQWIDKRLKKEY